MLLNICRFFQLLTTGLIAGILFGDRLGTTPIRPLLPPSSFVLYQQQLHRTYGKLMPVLMIVTLLSGAISLILMRRDYRQKHFLFIALGTVCLLAVMVMTVTVNVPINEQLMAWQVSSPPQNVMELWAPWERIHTIRTAFSIAGFGCLLLGSLVSRSTPRQSEV